MLYRDAIQASRRDVELSGEALVLQTACPTWLIEELQADPGLRAFSRRPEYEHLRLMEIARRPENILSLAYTASGMIVGQVTLAPLRDWGGKATDSYEAAFEVSSSWRRRGIARLLLTLLLETEEIEDLVLLGLGLSWHWDTNGLGLTRASYRAMLISFLTRYGFIECPTNEENICMDPSNVLLARIGARVPVETIIQFYNTLFL